MHLPNISIIVMHWNAEERTLSFLNQIKSWSYPTNKLNIILQDNASHNGPSEPIKSKVDQLSRDGYKIRYNMLEAHPGVTKAFNIAVDLASKKDKYVMRLDNDVVLDHDAITKMVEFAEENQKIGVVSPKLFIGEKKDNAMTGPLYIDALSGWWEDKKCTRIEYCDVLNGSVMLIKSEIIQRLGRCFDPTLYLFHEEPEFCWNVLKLGYKVCFFPLAEGYSNPGTSTGKHKDLSNYLNHRNSVVVANRITSRSQSFVRNLILFPRILLRSFRQRSYIPFIGYLDGLIERPISQRWWQDQISGNHFSRP